MQNRIFRVGIIGYGRSGRDIHAAEVKRSPDRFQIAAISDVSENRRAQAAQENDCKVYEDYRQMAERDDIDLFINTSFSSFHVPISIELLKQKRAVLCEKPLTDSMEEFERLEAVVRETGGFFTVYHNLRYAPVFMKLKEFVQSGLIGELVQISVVSNRFSRRWDWQTMRANGGGNMMVTGVHVLDQMLQLVGTGFTPEVCSTLKKVGDMGDADNYAKVILTAENMPLIDIECSYYDAFPKPHYSVQGKFGTIVNREGNKLEVKYYRPEDALPVEFTTEPLLNPEGNPVYCHDNLPMQSLVWMPDSESNFYGNSHRAYYHRLYGALMGQNDVPVTLDELHQQVRIMDACYRKYEASNR